MKIKCDQVTVQDQEVVSGMILSRYLILEIKSGLLFQQAVKDVIRDRF